MHFRLPAILLAVAALGAAQQSPRFDAVSIRPSTAADTSNRLGPTPQGGLRGQNVTVLQLIAMAYSVRPFQIVDAPGWGSTDRFDVTATPDTRKNPFPGTVFANDCARCWRNVSVS